MLRVALKPGSGVRVEELKHRLAREVAGPCCKTGCASGLRPERLADGAVDERVRGLSSLSSRPTSSTK